MLLLQRIVSIFSFGKSVSCWLWLLGGFVQSFIGFYVLRTNPKLEQEFPVVALLGDLMEWIPPLSKASMTWLRQGLEYSPFVLLWDQPLHVELFLKMGLVDFKPYHQA